MRTSIVTALVALLVACSSAEPPAPSAFDSSAGVVVVECLGDGFVRCDGERMPLEACVLRLRQRTRAMTPEQLQRFVVHAKPAAGAVADPLAGEGVSQQINRMLDELLIMGVGQARAL
jgi:hypothetical protein